MTAKRLNYMHDFMKNFKFLVIFNTIANFTIDNPDGLTHSDIIAMDPHIPRTRISRFMNKLTNDGFLEEKEIRTEIGRPKKYYTLTEKGVKHHKELKENLRNMYMNIREKLAGDLSEFDFQSIPKGRFDHIEHIFTNEEDTIAIKKQKLTEMKEELQLKINRITKALNELEKSD